MQVGLRDSGGGRWCLKVERPVMFSGSGWQIWGYQGGGGCGEGCMSVWMFQGENASLALRITAHQLLLLPAIPPLSLFFTRGNFLLLNAASGDEGVGLGGWLIPQVGAAFALGVRPVLRHQADRFALRFSSILKCGVRCVKEAILSCKCVFFCVW